MEHEYSPGDWQQIIDMTVALDVAVGGIMTVLASNPMVRDQLMFYLEEMQQSVQTTLPPSMRPGVSALLAKWHDEVATTPPMN